MTMQASFTYTPRDYIEAQRAYQQHLASRGKRLLGSGLILFGYLLLAFGIYNAAFGENLSLTIFCLAYGGFLVIYYGPGQAIRFRRDFNKAKSLQGEKNAIVGEEGFQISGDSGEGKIKWHAISRCTETPNLFVLLIPPRLFYMLPKRAFSDAEKSEIRRLIRDKTVTVNT